MEAVQRPIPKKTTTLSAGKTFCEFFAGIGLVREGLGPSGWQCVYANDIDPKKQEAYEARFGKSDHFHLGDVWKTDEVVDRILGQPVLMTASFPCIDLSLAGHYRGLQGEHSSTFFGFANVVEARGIVGRLWSCLKTSRVFFHRTKGRTLLPLSADWPTSDTGLTHLCSMLAISRRRVARGYSWWVWSRTSDQRMNPPLVFFGPLMNPPSCGLGRFSISSIICSCRRGG